MSQSSNKKTTSHAKVGTTITFNKDELTALSKYVAAGIVLLQSTHPVISRLKSALTRAGVEKPKGL